MALKNVLTLEEAKKQLHEVCNEMKLLEKKYKCHIRSGELGNIVHLISEVNKKQGAHYAHLCIKKAYVQSVIVHELSRNKMGAKHCLEVPWSTKSQVQGSNPCAPVNNEVLKQSIISLRSRKEMITDAIVSAGQTIITSPQDLVRRK